LRKKNQEGQASIERVGNFNLSVTRTTNLDLDLDCPTHANAPPPVPPPTYYHVPAAAAPPSLYQDLEEVKPTQGVTTHSQTQAQRSNRLAYTPTQGGAAADRSRARMDTSVKDGEDGLFPMIQVLNPQDGSPAYVFRAWRPSDIKDMAECLPDPSVAGGAALATPIAEMVQQHKPSIVEVGQVCVSRLGLRWGRIQGDMPAREQPDVMFDWAQAAPYRLLVEGLCERAFPLVRDWTAVRDANSAKARR